MSAGDKDERGLDLAAGIADPADEAAAAQDPELDAARGHWQDRLARLAVALPPEEPSAALWGRIAATLDSEPVALVGAVTVRAGEGEWQPLAEGIQIKLLSRDVCRGRRCFLLRMAPGSVLRPHEHAQAEECLMLEGDIAFNGVELKAGDFQYIPAGLTHPTGTTRNGCLVFVSAEL